MDTFLQRMIFSISLKTCPSSRLGSEKFLYEMGGLWYAPCLIGLYPVTLQADVFEEWGVCLFAHMYDVTFCWCIWAVKRLVW